MVGRGPAAIGHPERLPLVPWLGNAGQAGKGRRLSASGLPASGPLASSLPASGLPVGRPPVGGLGQQRQEQRPKLAQDLRRIGGAVRPVIFTLAPPQRAGLPPGLPT